MDYFELMTGLARQRAEPTKSKSDIEKQLLNLKKRLHNDVDMLADIENRHQINSSILRETIALTMEKIDQLEMQIKEQTLPELGSA